MFIDNQSALAHNLRMDLIGRIDARLTELGWGWADLARKMGMTEQRLNNWKKRGVPARELRNIESALNLSRYSLDDASSQAALEQAGDADEMVDAINLFVSTYRNSTDEGRMFLVNSIKAVASAFVREDRRKTEVSAINDRRGKK